MILTLNYKNMINFLSSVKINLIKCYHTGKNNDFVHLCFLFYLVNCAAEKIFMLTNFQLSDDNLEVYFSIIYMALIVFIFINLMFWIFTYALVKNYRNTFKLNDKIKIVIILLSIIPIVLNYFHIKNSYTFFIFGTLNLSFIVLFNYLFLKNIKKNFKEIKNNQFLLITNLTNYKPVFIFPSSKNSVSPNNFYCLTVNLNYKTWISLGLIAMANKKGIYIYKQFVSYDSIQIFNNLFNKKLNQYTQDEIELFKMYSI